MMCGNVSKTGANSSHLVASKEVQKIPLEQITLTDEYRFRVQDNEKKIDEYAESYRQYLDDKTADEESAQYPFDPIHLIRENGTHHVVDGRHRFQAAKKTGLKEMPCIVLTDRSEAIQVGLGSNRHGLPLNDGDKAKCIRIAVTEFSEWSNRRIANLIGCSSRYVDRIVKKENLRSDTHAVKGKDGKKYPVKPVQPKENVAPVPEPSAPEPAVTESDTVSVTSPADSPGLSDGEGIDQKETGTETESVTGFYVPVERKLELGEKLPTVTEPVAEIVSEKSPTSRIDPILDELKTAWELHLTMKPEQWATKVANAFKKLHTAAPTCEHRKRLGGKLQNVFRKWGFPSIFD